MSNSSQPNKLPTNPSLEHLQKQAKRRVKATPGLELAAAKHQLAQEYGCKNWAELVHEIEATTQRQATLERFVDAQRLARQGKPEEAVSGLLWCLDKSMSASPEVTGVKPASVVAALMLLGRSYPPALQAARERSTQMLKIGLSSKISAVDLPPGLEARDKIAHERYQKASQMTVRGEKPVETLNELLWCFDEGMKDSAAMRGVRRSFLLGSLVRLGETYPPAFSALQERRDAIRSNWLNDPEQWRDFVSINRALKEDGLSLGFYDELRRRGAPLPELRWIFDQFVDAKRYAEALEAKPVAVFLKTFNDYLETMVQHPEQPHAMHVLYLRNLVTKQVETLAGIGDLANARAVVAKMLEVDRSEETLKSLRTHAARAGHPNLITPECP